MAQKSKLTDDFLDDLESQKRRITKTEDGIKLNFNLLIGIAVVAVFGFAALFGTVGAVLQSEIAQKTNSYQSLVDKINEQNVRLDLLYNLWSDTGNVTESEQADAK